jgi:HlyD family secretion protein
MMQKTKTFISSHKIISIIILILIVIGAYFFILKNKTSGETEYVTEVVSKGNITTNVTGTGQVEASDTINLGSKTSGDITYLGVSVGQSVKKGTLIASVDSNDAKMALLNAQINLDNLTKGPDTLTLLQKQNGLTASYNSGWNMASSFINDMTLMISNLGDVYGSSGYLSYNNTLGLTSIGKTKLAQSESSYYNAKKSIDDLTKLYKTLTRTSKEKDINNLINESYKSAIIISNAVKDTEASFNYVVDYFGVSSSDSSTTITRTNITSWLSSSNSYVNNLLSSINNIKEDIQSLEDTVTGISQLDIQSAELSVQSKQDAYNGCFVYAPFDGIIATLTAKVGEPSGSSIGTLITKQKIATISLNEVDIAKIKLGQKVTLSFDAIDGLSITGQIAQIDSIGTVSQGVVSYNVQISLDVDDVRVKPGMSVSATIITDSAQDVIVVPSSAIKTQNGVSYVEVFNSPLAPTLLGAQGSPSVIPPKQIEVEIGLVGDTSTEIISGLKEGDIIVTKTIAGATTTAKSTTPSILSAVGGNRAGGGATGGAFRAVRGD